MSVYVSMNLCVSVCLLEPLYRSSSLTYLSSPSAFLLSSSFIHLTLRSFSSSPHPPCLLLLLIVPSLSLSSCASLSEYGPHRLPISLVCRRLQRLLQLADPPGRGPRAAPPPSAAAERQAQRPSTVGAAAETQPRTGYPPLRAPQPCSTSFRRAYLLPSPCYPSPLCRRGRHVRMSLETAAERHAPARTDH